MKINPIPHCPTAKLVKKVRTNHTPIINNSNMIMHTLRNLAILGASLLCTTACENEPDIDNIRYVEQCPKYDNPMKYIDGYIGKADYMMQLIGILPQDKSITDVKQIEVIQENGNKITLIPEENNDQDIQLKYISTRPYEEGDTTLMTIFDNPNFSDIRATVVAKGEINYQYISCTQSSAYPNSLYMHDTITPPNESSITKTSIIKRTSDGIIKINKDNSKEFLKINVVL